MLFKPLTNKAYSIERPLKTVHNHLSYNVVFGSGVLDDLLFKEILFQDLSLRSKREAREKDMAWLPYAYR